MTSAAVEIVLAWHAALNESDVQRLLSLSTDDVEVGGPRGAGRGADLLRDWVARAGVHRRRKHAYILFLMTKRHLAIGERTLFFRAARGPMVVAVEPA